EVERRYRIKAQRSTRAIAGLSMGGYGALYHAIKHKELFTHCYAMSAAVLLREPGEISSWEGDLGKKLWGPLNAQGLPENYKAHSVHEMIKALPTPDPSNAMAPKTGLPQLFIDCGDEDFLLAQNTSLIHLLREKRVP